MNTWIFLLAAVLLSLERICYLWIWRAPDAFRDWYKHLAVLDAPDPVDGLRLLFYGFKGLQCAVFLAWCFIYGNGALLPLSGSVLSFSLGAVLIVIGQILNASVFYRLGKVGAFYGERFGYEVPWCRKFPFSWLKHPQYTGALLSIWGFFLVMRFPHADWYMLPAVETMYYVLGAYFEADGPHLRSLSQGGRRGRRTTQFPVQLGSHRGNGTPGARDACCHSEKQGRADRR